MSAEHVEYIMVLKDAFSGILDKAHEKVKGFEHTFEKVSDITRQWGHALLGIAGIAEGFEFLKGAVEAFSESENQVAQLKAGIESTGGAAGITLQEMTKQATDFAETLPFAKSEIMNVQAQLLTFPAVTKATFTQATQAILDISTRTHHSTQEVSIMIGKALQNPVLGINALRRVGANFTAEQTDLIKHLIATGQSAKAQQFILHELATEYGGSAAAAADTVTGPVSVMSSKFEEQREKVGELIADGFMALRPVLNWLIEAFGKVVDAIRDSIEWFKVHKNATMTLAAILATVAVGFIALRVAMIAALVWEQITTLWTYGQIAAMYVLGDSYEGAAILAKVFAAAQYAINAAIEANPIGAVIALVAGLVGVVVFCYHHFAVFRAVLLGVWETVKEFGRIVADVFMGLWHVIHGVLTFDVKEIKLGGSEEIDAVFNAGQRLGGAFKKGYDEGMTGFNKDQANAADPNEKADKGPKPGRAAALAVPAGKTPAAKVSGQRITTINVTINGGLVHALTFQTTTIQESAAKIREHVIKALTSAVNDSQIIAEQ